jgi:hypothetical protein
MALIRKTQAYQASITTAGMFSDQEPEYQSPLFAWPLTAWLIGAGSVIPTSALAFFFPMGEHFAQSRRLFARLKELFLNC